MAGAFIGLSSFRSSFSRIHFFNIYKSPKHLLSVSAHSSTLHFVPLQFSRLTKKEFRSRIVVGMMPNTSTAPKLDIATPQDSVAGCPSSSSGSRIQLEHGVATAVDSQTSQGETERKRTHLGERFAYLSAAIASSVGVTILAAGAVYYRFAWQLQGGEVSLTELFGTFALAVGAAVGMEIWARWAHRALWHASLWSMHQSHHRPRDGPFELNDIFALINAVPAISLTAYGFFHEGLGPGLCFGAGLGITVFGVAYMFVHDGLVHRRFPVGPIADVPYFQKVAAAHQLHHANKFNGVPYGLFLGPKEVEEVGGGEELEKQLQRKRNKKGSRELERII